METASMYSTSYFRRGMCDLFIFQVVWEIVYQACNYNRGHSMLLNPLNTKECITEISDVSSLCSITMNQQSLIYLRLSFLENIILGQQSLIQVWWPILFETMHLPVTLTESFAFSLGVVLSLFCIQTPSNILTQTLYPMKELKEFTFIS